MKILFVIDIIDTHNNGTSISAQRFASELKRRGHEVRVLCANPQETDENGEALPVEVTGRYNVKELIVPIFDPLIKKHGFAYGDFLPRSRPIIREAVEWADVVHSYFPFPLDIVASNYAAKIGKPNTGAFHVQPENITMSLHCGKVKWVQNMLYRLFRNTFYYKYRHIHVPSAFMGRMLEERDYKAKIHVISNGIQDAFMEAGENKIDNGRPPKLPEYQDKIVIMMV